MLGAGSPPLHPFRLGLEFLLSGHREIDGMIALHAQLAQNFAKELGMPPAVANAVGSAYEYWNGRGWPGKLAGKDIPLAARIAQFAEYVEVAHRIGGPSAAAALSRECQGKQFDPALSELVAAGAAEIFDGLDRLAAWDAVIEAEPALAVVLSVGHRRQPRAVRRQRAERSPFDASRRRRDEPRCRFGTRLPRV
jgi:hypothetical protein